MTEKRYRAQCIYFTRFYCPKRNKQVSYRGYSYNDFELKGDGELELDETNWLENNTEFNFGLYAYMNGGVIMKFFKKELPLLEVETSKLPILKKTWPLMPKFVSQDNDYGIMGNKVSNRFIMDGGLMCERMKIYPVMSVYKDKELRKHYVYDTTLSDSKGQVFAFTVDKNEYDEEPEVRHAGDRPNAPHSG